MKFFCLLLAIFSPLQVFPEDLTVIERAIHQLPSECLADLPTSERELFIDHLLKDYPKNKRLDLENQFLEYYTDGDTPVHMSSMLYMKVFPDENGDLVMCHMPKPHADGNPPRLGQTFFFRLTEGHFVDITEKILPKTMEILPKKINLKWMFNPRRAVAEIEIGPYEKSKRSSGGDHVFIAKRPTMKLIWTGTMFEIEKLKSEKYSYDSL